MNFLKYRAQKLRESLDPLKAKTAELDRIDVELAGCRRHVAVMSSECVPHEALRDRARRFPKAKRSGFYNPLCGLSDLLRGKVRELCISNAEGVDFLAP